MKKMLDKIWEITRAWKNWISPTEEVKTIAEERMDVCQKCPFKGEQIGVDVCTICSCPLAGKTHSPVNSCPKGKWKR